MIEIICDDVTKWAENYEGERFQAILSDPPYALMSITERFGKEGSAPAKFGEDGRFSRLSKGFMGNEWDGFNDLYDYQNWVATWANFLIKNVLDKGALALFYGGRRTWHRLACGLEDGGFIVYDMIMWAYGQGFPKAYKVREGVYTPSGLKPAVEPIVLCMAPRGNYTFKKLFEEFGTGSLNIDDTRIPAEPYTINTFDDGAKPWGDAKGEDYTGREETKGRWPANFILDESSGRILDEQSGITGGGKTKFLKRKRRGFKLSGSEDNVQKANSPDTYGDEGGASRFFYCSKPNKSEKNRGLDEENEHPTVKPIDLNEYLATLLKIKDGGRMLIPFSGSGSEIIGAYQAGWENIVGIDSEEDYCDLARRRIQAWK